MSVASYLIDTNVFIGLEDPSIVPPNFASLTSLANRHGVALFVHEAAQDDIERDRDDGRRAISLSKANKFQTLKKVRGLKSEALVTSFGPLSRPNDVVDATLLHALFINAVDFLVTEDRGLHDRARRHSTQLAERVLYVADAVTLLRSTYEPVKVSLKFVEEVDAHEIPLTDPIFESLRLDYAPFDEWWREKCVKKHRKCWIVHDDDMLAGIVVRKDETPDDTDAHLTGKKILKICTFKVRPEKRGIKLGELLLRQIFWFAQRNKYDVVYLTTYARQVTLVDLLEYYGFKKTYTKLDGEMVYERSFSRTKVKPKQGESLFETARINYPRFHAGPSVPAYVIPIKEPFHDILFPELSASAQLSLFEQPGTGGPSRPGNTIRKVYLCRAMAKLEKPGAMLFFYKGKADAPPSQAITTVGIFEELALAHTPSELRRLAGGRSVYSDRQLKSFFENNGDTPVKVINFLLVGHVQPSLELADLLEEGIVNRHPWQSIAKLSREQLQPLLARANLGFAV